MNDVEKAFLSTLNSSPQNVQAARSRMITKNFFVFPESAWLYEIISYHNEVYNQPLQEDSLQLLLKQSVKISETLRPAVALLFSELKNYPPASNFELVMDQLVEYCKFNRVKRVFSKAVDSLGAGKVGDTIRDTLHDLNKVDHDLHPITQTSGFFRDDIPNIITEFHDRLQNPEKYRGVMLGIPTIDQATGGLQKGTVTLLMGEMKSGKSVLCTNIVYNLLQNNKRIYYHVNEGGKKLVYNRYISRATGLPVGRVRDGDRMSLEERQQYLAFLEAEMKKETDTDYYIDSVSPAASTIPYLSGKLKELQSIMPLDLVIIDHMGLMSSADKNIQSDWEKFGAIALGLKTLAAEQQIPIIAVTHVNREGMQTADTSDYKLEHIGRSNEPAKHVDLILSWRIQDPEAFSLQHMGEGKLSIIAARDAIQTTARLHVNTNIMKMNEYEVTVMH